MTVIKKVINFNSKQNVYICASIGPLYKAKYLMNNQ